MEGFEDVVERFDHISMAVNSLQDMGALMNLLNGRLHDRGVSTAGDFEWVQYDLPGSGRIEMIATSSKDPQHFITKFINTRGEGLHHITFKVSSIEAARLRAESLGFQVVGLNTTDPTWGELFIHPKSAHGVLIQFAEFQEPDV
ncbi:MAG: VOC family protein [Acidimicrobiia bacterium]